MARCRSISSPVAMPWSSSSVADEGDRRRLEGVAGGIAHREGGVGPHLGQPDGAEAAGQGAPVGQVDPAFGQQGAKATADAVGQLFGRSDLLQAAQGLQGRVGVLHQQDPAGPEGGGHGGQGGVALRHVHQDEAGMDEVERSGRWRVGTHVVLEDLDVGGDGLAGPGHVDVGGEDVAAGADPLGEVVDHRGPARPHLPAAPARGQAQAVEMPERGGIEQGGEGGEAVHRLRGVVREQVPPCRHDVSVVMAPACWPRSIRAGCPRNDRARRPPRPAPRRSGWPWRRSRGTRPRARRHR